MNPSNIATKVDLDNFDDLLQKPEKSGDPLPKFPAELKTAMAFLHHVDKKPYQNGESSNDKAKDISYSAAIEFAITNPKYKLGRHILEGEFCIDIDKCIGSSGELMPNAREIVDSVPIYWEISPSGRGVHGWGRGTKPKGVGSRKGSIEIYDGTTTRYMTVTGLSLHNPSQPVREVDLTEICAKYLRDSESAGNPTTTASSSVSTAATRSTQVQSQGTSVTSKFELLFDGEIESERPFVLRDGYGNKLSYDSWSEVEMAFCNLSAFKHRDAGLREVELEDSIWSDYLAWPMRIEANREKWIKREKDFRRSTIAKAIATAIANPPISKSGEKSAIREEAGGAEGQTDGLRSFHGLKFALPQVIPDPKTGHLNFVCAPLSGQRDGLFPLGDVSVSCAPSGGGKSSLNYSMLDSQRRRENFFGHETFGRPFLILCYDRGENAAKRTMGRLGLEGREKDFPTTYLSPMLDDPNAIAQNIIEKIESAEEFPQIVYVEGGDLASTDPSKLAPTKQFLTRLQKIAEYYHIGIILSVGSPKTKIGEGYTAKRDNIFGSSVWGRMVETVAVLFYRQGDDTDSRRTLFILPRNARSERYDLIFTDGKLVIDPNPNYEEESPEERWFESQGSRWFTANDLMKGLNVSRSTSRNIVREAHRQGIIRRKTGRPRNGEGAIAQYQWIDPDRVVSPISQPAIEVDF